MILPMYVVELRISKGFGLPGEGMNRFVLDLRRAAAWGARVCAGFLVSLWLLPLALAAEDFLPPEQAFRFEAQVADGRTLALRFHVAPGYYLYRERLAFEAVPAGVQLGAVVLPQGKVKFDETFQKEVETYRDTLDISVPVLAAPQVFLLKVSSQGCADQGLCYPPQQQVLKLVVREGGLASATRLTTDEAALWVATADAEIQPLTANVSKAVSPVVGTDTSAGAPPAAAGWAGGSLLNEALRGGRLWRIAGVFLLAGVLLSFTPCVLPMLPILSSIIVGQVANPSRWRGLGLSAAYVLGMALVYTALGVAAGLAGEGLAAALQQPAVLWAFAILLVLLALSMLGAYELRLPSALQTRLSSAATRLPGGQVTGVFLMGGLSALIVSPCVAAPLAGALVYISQTRDVVVGAVALFAMALGMGVPLLLVGVSAGSLLPRTGAWMESVKRFFGVMLLAVALWLVGPVLAPWTQMLLWAALLCGSAAALLGLGDRRDAVGPLRRATQGLGLLLVLLAGALVLGALSGGRDLWQPLRQLGQGGQASTVASLPFQAIKGVEALDAALQAADRPVLLDFYADWCVSCKEMERFTFSDAQVQSRLSGLLLLRADVTANDAQDRALLKRFGLFGPPAILFFKPGAQEVSEARVIGFQDSSTFLKVLGRVVP